jgi:hypothetical protein
MAKGATVGRVVDYNRGHTIVEGAAWTAPPPQQLITWKFIQVVPTIEFNPDGTVHGLFHKWQQRADIHLDDDLLLEYGLL